MTILNHNFENSSMLSGCTYDTETHELMVEFNNGKQYTYVDVGESIYHDLINAQSAGKYFNAIKKDLKLK